VYKCPNCGKVLKFMWEYWEETNVYEVEDKKRTIIKTEEGELLGTQCPECKECFDGKRAEEFLIKEED